MVPRRTLLALVLLSFLTALPLHAETAAPNVSPEFKKQHSAVWTLVEVAADPATQSLLRTMDVDVEGGTSDRLHVAVRADGLDQLREARIPYRILHADLSAMKPETLGERGLSYHDADGVLFVLQALADEYLEIARYI